VVKVMISMPEGLLERVDREAAARGTTRSAFLQEAAKRDLGWPDPTEIDAALSRGRAALGGTGRYDSADAIRQDRDARDARDRRR
jgi:hypothetical protein